MNVVDIVTPVGKLQKVQDLMNRYDVDQELYEQVTHQGVKLIKQEQENRGDDKNLLSEEQEKTFIDNIQGYIITH